MRTGGTSRRMRSSHPGADLMPLMKRATPRGARSAPRAPRAARARAGLTLGARRSPSRGPGVVASPRRRRRRCPAEGLGDRSAGDVDSDGSLSIVDGIREMACADEDPEERPFMFGGLGRCEGAEGLLLLSVIAEAQEGAKSRKRVKLPDVPARRCGYCGARSTVQWRSGPKEVPILCNACGVKYRKGKLQPKDMADRALEIDDLESGAALGMRPPVDQASGNSNSSAALSPRFKPGQLHPKTPRGSSSSTAGAWPFGAGPEAAPQGPLGSNPAGWGFAPHMMAPNQPHPVALQPQLGQVSCMGDCTQMLPLPPLVYAEEEGIQEMSSWPRRGWHGGWRSHPAWGLCRGSLDVPIEEGENEGPSGAGHPAGLRAVVTNSSPRNLESDKWDSGAMGGNEGGVTLRWLAKRKRTGPKAEV